LQTAKGPSIVVPCALLCAAISAAAGAIAQAPPPQANVDLENEYVRVSSIPPAAAQVTRFNDCKVMSGNAMVLLYVVPQRGASAKNDGDQGGPKRVLPSYIAPRGSYKCAQLKDVTQVLIELKSKPAASRFTDDAVKLDPAHNEVLLDNDRVRVVRIHFAPGETGPMVDKRPRVIVVLTDSHASVTLPDGHSEIRDAKAGTIYFGRAGRQTTNNLGTTPLENIVVELKSK